MQCIYSNVEDLVFHARSEELGCAVNACHGGIGMIEHWNTEFGGKNLFLWDWQKPVKNKFRPISAFDPQNSIFPSFHYSMSYLTAKPSLWGEVKA